MLDTKLIERALQLTGKTMEEMNIDYIAYCEIPVENEFSIEKFCYYLLSPEFIEKYDWIIHTSRYFWEAIYEYQKWNEEPIISLLSKI